MKRTLNYTGRRKLVKDCATVRVYGTLEEGRTFDVELTLLDDAAGKFAAGTQIYVEAYYRAVMMRYPIGAYTPGQTTYTLRGARLDDIDNPTVNFRIKLVDVSDRIGRIVGVIDRISAHSDTDQRITQIGLLPVTFDDVTKGVWRLTVESGDEGGEMPTLHINSGLAIDQGTLRNIIATDPQFVSLVLPEVVRQIMTVLAALDDDPEDDWQINWLRFAKQLTGSPRPTTDDDAKRNEWVTGVVEKFCKQHQIDKRFEASFINDAS